MQKHSLDDLAFAIEFKVSQEREREELDYEVLILEYSEFRGNTMYSGNTSYCGIEKSVFEYSTD